METVLPLPRARHRSRRARYEALFTGPWMALAVPLLVPLVVFLLR